MHINIRYWINRELQIYRSVNTFGMFLNRRENGEWRWHRDLVHFRIENLKNRCG